MSIQATAVPSPVALLQMVTGYWVSQAIYVAAKLGVADLLKDGPKNYDELAKATGTHARSLYRLLRALASVGVFAEAEDGRFGLTPLGEYLQTGIPSSVRALTISYGERAYRAWGDLLHSVRTGETAYNHVFGMDLWQYLAQNPEAVAILNMLVMAGGCERTEAEYRALFAAAGFTLTNIIPIQSPFSFSVIEGVRA